MGGKSRACSGDCGAAVGSSQCALSRLRACWIQPCLILEPRLLIQVAEYPIRPDIQSGRESAPGRIRPRLILGLLRLVQRFVQQTRNRPLGPRQFVWGAVRGRLFFLPVAGCFEPDPGSKLGVCVVASAALPVAFRSTRLEVLITPNGRTRRRAAPATLKPDGQTLLDRKVLVKINFTDIE